MKLYAQETFHLYVSLCYGRRAMRSMTCPRWMRPKIRGIVIGCDYRFTLRGPNANSIIYSNKNEIKHASWNSSTSLYDYFITRLYLILAKLYVYKRIAIIFSSILHPCSLNVMLF